MVTICHVGTVATLFGLATWIPTYLTQFRVSHSARSEAGSPGRIGFPSRGNPGGIFCRPQHAARAGRKRHGRRRRRPGPDRRARAEHVASVLLLATTLASPVIYGALNASIMQGMALPGRLAAPPEFSSAYPI